MSRIKKTAETLLIKLYATLLDKVSEISSKLNVSGIVTELKTAIKRIMMSHQNFQASFYLIVNSKQLKIDFLVGT
jgi:hypothetical protein